jgi:hypothetical protein
VTIVVSVVGRVISPPILLLLKCAL